MRSGSAGAGGIISAPAFGMSSAVDASMTERTASCSCGRLTVRVRGEPVRVSICHCRACQRRTGSVFGVQARFRRAEAELSGEGRVYERARSEGTSVRFTFCPHCGATVHYAFSDDDGVVAIPVGCFADATFPAPRISVWEERMHPWVSLPEGIEHIP
jgi:hypothetical protein